MTTKIVWDYWDRTVRLITRIKPLKHDESHLFCIGQHRYLGRGFTVDGVNVHRFDRVIGLHLNNAMLTQVLHENPTLVSIAIRLLQEVNKSLPILADCVSSQKYRKAKILFGITLIHRGIEKFGFHVFPVKKKITNTFFTWYLRNIFCTFNPNGNSLIQARPEAFVPKFVAISKRKLIESYSKK